MPPIRLCLKSREPVPYDPDAPWAKGLDSNLATVALYEGTTPDALRVIFAAETRQMEMMENSEDSDHPHVVIEPWQAVATYSVN